MYYLPIPGAVKNKWLGKETERAERKRQRWK